LVVAQAGTSNQAMKVLFFGSKGMGALALDELHRQDADVVAVVARWDDPSPGQWYPSVTEQAEHLRLQVLRPENVNDDRFLVGIRELAMDILFTAFYPRLFKRPLLEVAPHGSVNLHFAPLPRYRGSYPGAWAINRGETKHGVSLHYMSPGVDSGDVIDQEFVDIDPDDTGYSLYGKCEQTGLELVRRVWPTPQLDAEALYFNRDYPYGGVINFNWTARQIYDYVRGMTFPPFPNPFTYFAGRKLTVTRCRTPKDGGSEIAVPGSILRLAETMTVQAGNGIIELLEFQNTMGNPLSVDDAASSLSLSAGDVIGR
jgi:methionyl-tRNA formyltransferase